MAYTILNDVTVDTTLTAGTYLLNYDVNWNGKSLTFNCAAGPIIIKRAGDYCFNLLSTVNTTNSTSTNKVYWTDKNDDTVGDTIAGSTGTPVKSGLQLQNIATVADGYYLTAAVTLAYHEIRYASNRNFVYASGNTGKSMQYVTFKSCDYSSVAVFILLGGSTSAFKYIMFDSTNTMTGTASLLGELALPINGFPATNSFDHVFVENANTSSAVIYESVSNLSHTAVRIKNAGYFGVLQNDCRTGVSKYYDSCVTVYCKYLSGVPNATSFYNCLFDAALTGYSAYAISRGTDTNYDVTITVNNCVFKGYTKVFYNREYGGNQETYITATNCIFDSNTQLLNVDDLTHQTANYCGYYNNGETYWTRGANDFTANPSFGNTNGTIDATFDDYIPNGYKPSTADYQNKGSDTWDNLTIDEATYSPDGLRHKGTAKIWPGIYYQMTTFGGQADITSALTLPAPILAATGTAEAGGETGTVAITLPVIQLVSTGFLTHFASSALTLPQLTLASAGYLTHFASSAITLPVISLAAAGIQIKSASVALTLPILSIATSGQVAKQATVAITLPVLSLSSTAVHCIYATLSLTLPVVILSATGKNILNRATIALTLPVVSISSTGQVAKQASVAITLPVISIASTGIHCIYATLSLTLPVAQLAASGTLHEFIEGTIALTLPVATIETIGQTTKQATSALTLPVVSLSATGIQIKTAAIAITLPVVSSSSTGFLTHFATIAINLPVIHVCARASSTTGTVAITLPVITLQSSGIVSLAASVAITLPVVSSSSIGYKLHEGTTSVTLPVLSISSTGIHYSLGSVSLYLPIQDVQVLGHKVVTGASTLTLPVVQVAVVGHFISGSSNVTLPQIQVATSGYLTHYATVAITLPQLQVAATGRFNSAEIALTLPVALVVSSGFLTHFASSTIELPVVSVHAMAVYVRTGNIACTLPIQTIVSTGHKLNESAVTCTLPVLSLATTGYVAHVAHIALVLPSPSLEASGHLIRLVNGNIYLPVVRLSSQGYLTHFASSVITLPVIRIVSSGYLTHFASIATTLPVVSISSTGVHVRIGTIAITLPVGIAVASTSFTIPVGVEWLAYNQLVTNLQANMTGVTTWQFDNKSRILRPSDYPYVQVLDKGIVKETFIAHPRRKMTTLSIQIVIRTFNGNQNLLEINKLAIQEQAKDALEQDVQLSGRASMLYIRDAKHKQISRDIAQSVIDVEVNTTRFATESRI